jgi:hypothetical protein
MRKRSLPILCLYLGFLLLALTLSCSARSAHAQPEPTMVISPPSGPCDGTVEVTGSGFEPGTTVGLNLARPHSEGAMAKLGSVTADPAGDFSLAVSLGAVGCEAAALDTRADGPGEPKDLQIYASYEPTRPRIAAWAVYTYSTTSPSSPPSTFPGAGSGGDAWTPGTLRPGAVLGLTLGGLLLALGAASALYYRRSGP